MFRDAASMVDRKRGSREDICDCKTVVRLAETPFGGTRSKGYSVVQFSQTREAWTTIANFSATRGQSPVDMRFDDRWRNFLPSAAHDAGGFLM
ncbi:hypothetical protein EV401DRAFT_152682 [Pisolithus croceorrhizus]|nr:hypothetical protein EV401DRAFT_152682 [Pisolithus croceorrhizus]